MMLYVELNLYMKIIDYIEAENEDTSKVVLNVEKLKKLGFNYSINIKEGLKKIIEERGMSDGKF